MTATNQADRSLMLAASRLTTGRKAQRLTTQWAHDPHLLGWTPAELLEALTHRGHDDHDRIVRGLTTRSQHHDEDATVLTIMARQMASVLDVARRQRGQPSRRDTGHLLG